MDTKRDGSIAAVALVADLMFASRVRGAASAVGVEAVTVGKVDALLEAARTRRPGVVLLDLDARGIDVPSLVARLKADPETAHLRIIAYGAHVNTEALLAARNAGADRVMARSAFVRELPEILRG